MEVMLLESESKYGDGYGLFAFLRMENYPGIRTQIFGSLIEIPMNLLGKPMNFSTNFPGRPVS